MTNEQEVRKALVEICSANPCASISDLMSATGLRQSEVRKALKPMERDHRVVLVKQRRGAVFVNPLNARGEPLICGTWCRQ